MSRSARTWLISRMSSVFVAVVLASIGAASMAHYMGPMPMPTARLIPNTQNYIKEHPYDANGYYVLGRIYSYAFVRGFDDVRVEHYGDSRELLEPAKSCLQTGAYQDRRDLASLQGTTFGPALSPEQRLDHLRASLVNLNKALELDPKAAGHHLSLAYAIRSGAHLAAQLDTPTLIPSKVAPIDGDARLKFAGCINSIEFGNKDSYEKALADLRAMLDASIALVNERRCDAKPVIQRAMALLLEEYWRERAIDEYWAAFEIAVAGPLPTTQTQAPGGFHAVAAYEAAESFIELVGQRPIRSDAEKDRVAQANAAIRKMDALPPQGFITPIILSFDESSSIDDLLEPDAIVSFDLDGTHRRQSWPWLQPTTALLVWDPARSGEISSGRQLLGSVSWWMFFDDGYRALDALDDDRNGWLSGAELDGLALWFDRDGDGVSLPDEVIPLEKTSIVALSTRATTLDGISPKSDGGLILADGRRLPTYDWTVESVPAPKLRPVP